MYPIFSASSAVKSLPVSARSLNQPCPTMYGRRCRVPMSAMMAMRVSRMEKTASSDAILMSQALVKSTPPPMQCPWIAAMTGFLHFSMAVILAWSSLIFRYSQSRYTADPSPRSAWAATRSRPAVKLFPSARMTTTRTSGSASNSSKHRVISSKNSGVMVLRCRGRFSTSQATCPLFSTFRLGPAAVSVSSFLTLI